MEEKEESIKEEKSQKINISWKKFFKEQIFLLIVGALAFIIYLIIYFLKKDNVYLYLSIGTPCIILIWIGISALYIFLKEKKIMKYSNKSNEN